MGKRKIVQLLWTAITNLNIMGFVRGDIYQGSLKTMCVPGLNCYSCPGALGSCPIGALQAVIGSKGKLFSFYIVGFLVFIGALFGRFACGWLCPFGLLQELLYKIPFLKKIKSVPMDRLIRKFKYIVLIVFVVLMPMFLTDIIGQGAPYFCKLICPAGTLEGGIALVIANPLLREALGFLYAWKLVILIITIVTALMIYRPFCKYLCPLGAVYSVFNPIAVFGYRYDATVCNGCGECRNVCKMGLSPTAELNHPECIHCDACKNICKSHAIKRMCVTRKDINEKIYESKEGCQ